MLTLFQIHFLNKEKTEQLTKVFYFNFKINELYVAS